MSKQVFISFAGNDRHWVEKLQKWNDEGKLGTDIKVTSERNDYRQEGKGAIKKELNNLIQGASKAVFLVGKDTHDRKWVDHEIQQAQQRGKEILVARIPGTKGGKPSALSKYKEIPLHPDSLKKHL